LFIYLRTLNIILRTLNIIFYASTRVVKKLLNANLESSTRVTWHNPIVIWCEMASDLPEV